MQSKRPHPVAVSWLIAAATLIMHWRQYLLDRPSLRALPVSGTALRKGLLRRLSQLTALTQKVLAPGGLSAICGNQSGAEPHLCTSFSEMFTVAGLVVVAMLLLALLVLNQRKKTIITNKSKALEETEARYRLLFEHSPIPLLEEDLSAVKTFIDQL